MTIQELNQRYIIRDTAVAVLTQKYYGRLYQLASAWVYDPAACESLARGAIDLLSDRSSHYWSTTDCFCALVGCMRRLFVERLGDGSLEAGRCFDPARQWYDRRVEISDLPEKQLNLVLSEFTRPMFDYFVDRYFFLKEIPIDPKMEKKIAKLFSGGGSVAPLHQMNHFQKAVCTPEAYFFYASFMDSYFVAQIGSGKRIAAHPAGMEHPLLRHRVNRARYAFPVVLGMFILALILAYLSIHGILPI